MHRDNLFFVDLDQVKRLLTEANASLSNRCSELIGSSERMPSALATEEDFSKGLRLARAITAQLAECRKARLSDGKAFKNAVGAVEAYFGEFEKPLKIARERVLSAVTRAEQNRQRAASTMLREAVVSTSNDGAALVVARPEQKRDTPTLELEWVVESIDRAIVDLDALRPYLSDYVIKLAAAKWLKEKGPREIRGVRFEPRARL